MAEFEIRPPRDAADLDAIRALCWDYRDYLLANSREDRVIIDHFYPEDYYATVMAGLATDHAPPDGTLLLALDGQGPAGCGMFRRLSADACEWKRVYVAPRARGLGLGRALSLALADASRVAGYRRIYLDTGHFLVAAQNLYEAVGFERCEAYYDVPEIAQGRIVFYRMDL